MPTLLRCIERFALRPFLSLAVYARYSDSRLPVRNVFSQSSSGKANSERRMVYWLPPKKIIQVKCVAESDKKIESESERDWAVLRHYQVTGSRLIWGIVKVTGFGITIGNDKHVMHVQRVCFGGREKQLSSERSVSENMRTE